MLESVLCADGEARPTQGDLTVFSRTDEKLWFRDLQGPPSTTIHLAC